jgi:glycosyltransferase involved in cell wall biosynthesis
MIAFLIEDLVTTGGTSKQLLRLVDYVASQGIEFKIILKRVDFNKTYLGFTKFEDKIFILPFNKRKWKILNVIEVLNYARRLRNTIQDAEIINIHDRGFENYLHVFKNKRVYWQVNDLPYVFKEGVSSKVKLGVFDLFSKLYILYKKKIITEFLVNSTKNAKRIYKHFDRTAQVYYCGIDPIEVSRDYELSIKRFEKRTINILTSGILGYFRNYETQIEVIKLLLDYGIDAHLNIIGSTIRSPEYVKKISNMINSNHLEEQITICGQVDDISFKQLHKDSDIFIFINVEQSWGLSIFEAMSCGLPVIISNSVGAVEILTNDENAIFVDPLDASSIRDKIISLMDNKNKYLKFVEASKNFTEKYTWEDAYCSRMFKLMLYK